MHQANQASVAFTVKKFFIKNKKSALFLQIKKK